MSTAGAAVFTARARPAPGPLFALAVSVALHLLAALLWMQERRPPVPEAPRTISILLQRPAPPPPPPRSHPADHTPHAQAARPAPQPAAQPDDRPVQAPAAAQPPPAAPVPGLDQAPAPADVKQAIRDQAAADGGFAAGLSRRQAGRIDRELRHGKSGIPNEPDTAIGRLRRGFDGARTDGSMSVYEDNYTGPDGTVIYRKHIGKGTICRRSGYVSPLGMSAMHFGGEAANVECPSGVEWKRD